MESQTTRTTDAVEFTHDWYRQFLDRIRNAGYDFRRFADDIGAGDVLLRHDVDLSVDDAVEMAHIEAERDVQSTYCVLLTAALYNPLEREQREQIREIQSLGHEVALHFSTHEYWDERPDEATLQERVEEERAILDTVVGESPETVSFHMPPSWVLNRSLDGVRNTYAPEYFNEITYVADSGQRWRETPPEIAEFGDVVQVLTHPGLWGETDADFESRIEDSIVAADERTTAKARREFLQEDN